MKRLLLIVALFLVGCESPPPPPEPPVPVNDAPGFTFIDSREMNLLNSWRQENFDKHIVCFDDTGNGFLIHWIDNPGNSRQTFVWEKSDPEILWYVERMTKIKEKYTNQEIVDVCVMNEGYIVLLQDKLEPYKPSVQ